MGSALGKAHPSKSAPVCRGKPPRSLRVHASDGKLRHEAMIALLPLVHRVAIRIRCRLPAHIETDELVSAGMLGLVDAIRKFDSRRQVKLESYASHRIRGAILDSLRSLDTASRDVRKKGKKAERVHRELELRMGCAPDDEAMARGLGMSLKKWHRTAREIHLAGAGTYLYARSLRHHDLSEEMIAAANSADQFDLCYLREQKELVARALAILPERERMIFTLYYGREFTMNQTGQLLNIGESRVSQLHSAGLARVRALVMEYIHPPSHEGSRDDSFRFVAPRGAGFIPSFRGLNLSRAPI